MTAPGQSRRFGPAVSPCTIGPQGAAHHDYLGFDPGRQDGSLLIIRYSITGLCRVNWEAGNVGEFRSAN
jgi:hypothetical protein